MTSIGSVAQLCLTLCNPIDCSTQGFPVHHQLPELAQTHVHQVGAVIQPSHTLSSPSPAFPSIRVFSKESVLLIRWPNFGVSVSMGRSTGVGCHDSSMGSSRPRDRTHISCSTGRFFTAEPWAKPIYLILYIFFLRRKKIEFYSNETGL